MRLIRAVWAMAATSACRWAPPSTKPRRTPSHAAPRAGGTSSAAPALVLFMLQIVTGICLALVYVPSADEAYQSLHVPELRAAARLVPARDARLGLELHGGGRPAPHDPGLPVRRLQVSARADLGRRRRSCSCCTLGMAFTGQILRWDQDAYWGLGIGASIAGRAPVIGPQVVQVLLGGPIIAGETLTRFFALHVFVIPGAAHRPRRRPPAAGAQARRSTSGRCPAGSCKREDLPEGVRGAGPQGRRAVRARGLPRRTWSSPALISLVVMACAAVFGPSGRRACPIPRSSTPCRGPTSSSSGSSRSLALLPPHLETLRPARRTRRRHRPRSWRCRSSRARARRAGGGGPWPCSRS